MKTIFEWDDSKNSINQEKQGVSFYEAQFAFTDSHRIIIGAGYWRGGKKIYEKAKKSKIYA